jgi:hypothetical protein
MVVVGSALDVLAPPDDVGPVDVSREVGVDVAGGVETAGAAVSADPSDPPR